jgi:hypothetical protein
MFGLMKRPPRLPYCGTCKTMGARYGQGSRMLLNHDTVFLAELLLEYGGTPEWSPAYRSFNCLASPAQDEIPAALDFAAAATIVLAHFRIEDHRADSGRRWWTWLGHALSPSYRKAVARLRTWNFPIDELADVLQSQGAREAQMVSLADVAEPTARATALFFEHGARVIGREDLGSMMYRIGHRFGFLIYALDAVEDRERDARRGDFNPLLKLPWIDARAEILAAAAEIEKEVPQALSMRLRANVEERLGLRPRVLAQRCKRSARERWLDAVALARSLRKKESAIIFAAGCIAAYVAPHQMRHAESLRHGLGISMNLMALGAILASAAPPPPPPPGNHAPYQPHVAVPSGRSGGCSWCTCCNTCCLAECCAEGCCEACCNVGECCNGCG